MRKSNNPFLLVVMVVIVSGCAISGGVSPEDRRQKVLAMKDETLADLYQYTPYTRNLIAEAPGYAVFSNANVNVIFASFGGGYGVVRNNSNGRHTYMKMGEVGVGIGLGIKDFRAIFIFHDEATLNDFIDKGWQFGGQADAAAIADDKGLGAVGGEVVLDNITIYQLTRTGLALQATIKGTRYWKDDELN